MSGLGILFMRRGTQAHPTAGSDYILSENRGDPEVFRILMSKGVSADGVGITKDDAAKVTSIGTWFRDNTIIRSFDELQFFTNLTSFGAFYNTDKGTFGGCSSLKSVIIPLEITNINHQAFRDCVALENVNIGHLVKIGKFSFRNSGIAGDINCPNLETLDYSAFSQCPNITRIVNLGKVTELLGSTYPSDTTMGGFAYCTNLQEAVINDCVTAIGYNMFYSCTALKSIVCHATTPPSLGNANALKTNSNLVIYVPDASVAAYKAANVWSTYASIIKGISEYNG